MKAAIVTIGDEILIGQIVDTNSAFIAKALDDIGFQIVEMISISDTEKAISETMNRYQNQVDLVVMTGGLGPTKDDVTKKTFCSYFNDILISDSEVLKHVTALIEDFYKRKITQMNIDQALVPSNATVLFNKVGTAPGMLMKHEQTFFVSLPGVPYEMKYLVSEVLIPYLEQSFEPSYNIHQTLITHGVGESLLAERIADWENDLPSYIHLAYLPSPRMVKLRLSTSGKDKVFLEDAIREQVEKLLPLIKDCLIGLNENETIFKVVSDLLKENNLTIACAESCTGGQIAKLLNEIPGASAYFQGGVVAYATQSKIDVLGVSENTINKNSVVSEQVALEMALGAKRLFKSDLAIATTGNAGPSKGDSDVEVGTVCLALVSKFGEKTFTFNFGQPREKVIDSAVNKAFEIIREEIIKNNS